jgi:hypothetical protein
MSGSSWVDAYVVVITMGCMPQTQQQQQQQQQQG